MTNMKWVVIFSNKNDPFIVEADSRNKAKIVAIKKAKGIFSYTYQEQQIMNIRRLRIPNCMKGSRNEIPP
jgi:hypothetical protein